MSNRITWNEENTAKLVELAGDANVEVSQERLSEIADEMGITKRSAGAKLRKLEFVVQKADAVKSARWTPEQEAALTAFVESNANELTYAEIAAAFEGGVHTPKQIQGKLLNLELFGLVKPTEKTAAPRSYTEAEEAKFIEMAAVGAALEDIASALNKSINSVRGKALSLSRQVEGFEIPKQRETRARQAVDVLEGLDISSMEVAAIAEATGKTERGIKAMLSRRGVDCADYKGAAKRAKLDAASAE